MDREGDGGGRRPASLFRRRECTIESLRIPRRAARARNCELARFSRKNVRRTLIITRGPKFHPADRYVQVLRGSGIHERTQILCRVCKRRIISFADMNFAVDKNISYHLIGTSLTCTSRKTTDILPKGDTSESRNLILRLISLSFASMKMTRGTERDTKTTASGCIKISDGETSSSESLKNSRIRQSGSRNRQAA